jgi:hypothetical protein
MTYKDALTGRLKFDERMAIGDLRQPVEGSEKLLIYAAIMHPEVSFPLLYAQQNLASGIGLGG